MNSRLLLLVASCSLIAVPGGIAADTFPVTVTVDAATTTGPLRRIWRYFGADEPNYTTMPAGEALLGEMGELAPNQTYLRLHNLLTTGDGKPALKWGSTNIYTEDAAGNPVYSWTIVDGIFDAMRAHDVRPLVEIGFMPQALSQKPEKYRHTWSQNGDLFTGWTTPPTDYKKWSELVYQWAKHCVEKYGAAEVEHWWWETWNEPNIGYWSGTPEEFFKLTDYALAGVRRALPTARVGGPHTAGDGGEFMVKYLDHVLHGTNYATGKPGTPLDYLAFHAKGSPEFVDGHVRMGIANQLRTIDTAFARFSKYPELKGMPVIIGESDPEGCAACQGPKFSYRNGTVYSSYTAAVFARKHDLADMHDINLEGALTWAFTFADQPWFAGFRQVASNGVPMPVFNVFRMYAKMGPDRVAATSTGETPLAAILANGVRGDPDVGVLASRGPQQVAIMVWHYHDDDVPGPAAAVQVDVKGLPKGVSKARLTHYRIDHDHSNAYTTWQRLGSPEQPNVEQLEQIKTASNLTALADAPADVAVAQGAASLNFMLPRQGISLLVLDLPAAASR